MFFCIFEHKIHHTNSKLQVNMKKIIFIMLLGLVCNTINAQIVTKRKPPIKYPYKKESL